MNCIFKNELEYKNFLLLLEDKLIGSGSEGDCYRLDNRTVFKDFCGLRSMGLMMTKEQFLQFSNINISNYIFLKELVYINDEIVGGLMRYASGKVLYNNPLCKTKYSNIITAFEDLTIATKKLSDLSVLVCDTYVTNILFNKNKFYLIDTTNYRYTSIDTSKLFNENMYRLTTNIYSRLLNGFMVKYIQNKMGLQNFRKDKQLLSNPVEFLKMLKESLDENCGKDVNSLDEAVKILKR